MNTAIDEIGRQARPRDWSRWRTNAHGVELFEAEFETHVYERHIHETYAVAVTLRGVQRFWCRGATHDSVAGNVIAINPGESHDGRSGSAGGYAYRMIYVPIEVMRAVVDGMREHSTYDVNFKSPVFNDPDLAQRLHVAWKALADRGRTLAGEELLGDALLGLACQYSDVELPQDGGLHWRALKNVRDFLHAHVEDELRAEALAEVAGISRFRLTRQFQRAFGLPLHAYHLHLRLEEAKRRLRSGVPIVQVAAALGFADQSHFHRRFKGAFGITPHAWQRAAVCDSARRTGAAQGSKIPGPC